MLSMTHFLPNIFDPQLVESVGVDMKHYFYILMLLIRDFSFQLKQFPLEFLVRQV
jgi:hypothetical protein